MAVQGLRPRRRTGSSFRLKLAVVVLSIHVAAGACASCDDSFERTTARGRRQLAVNLTQSAVEDGEALLRIKASIVADPLNVTYWWKPTGAKKALSPCKTRNYQPQYWPGIDCTNKRVTAINLSSMSLAGELSPALGAIAFLRTVDLSNNLFTGPIPDDLTSAARLQTLDLANNRLDGTLPVSLGNMTSLTSLNAANNLVNGPIPASIGALAILQTLNLSGNNLSGAIPEELNRCGKLNAVDLSRNRLQGSVPLRNLSDLTVLQLQRNNLEGDFVSRLDALPRLEDLDLSHNLLNGTIPAAVASLPLRKLLLHQNDLVGEIPPALGRLSLVQRIDLSFNNLTGDIPASVGELLSLQEFNVSLNELYGEIPPSLVGLPALAVLDISRNHVGGRLPGFAGARSLRWLDLAFNSFTGPLPANFVDFAALRYLNVSYNDLRGAVPAFAEHDNVTRRSFIHTRLCGPLLGVPCDPPPSETHNATVVSIAVGCSVGFLLLFAIVCVLCSRHHEKKNQLKKFANVSAELEVTLTPEQLVRATQSFHARNKIGEGSAGAVFRAVLPMDTPVAVKKLAARNIDESTEKALRAGFETLSHVRHWSMVNTVGFCCSPDVTALVVEFMPNGTLRDLLYPTHPDSHPAHEFTWTRRFNTAISVAEGLTYLHHKCPSPTVHGDLKPSNILFNAFMEARIADVGVAKLLSDRHLVARPALELGLDNSYKAPESANLLAETMKGDVYSFGVIVLEMMSGRNPRLLGAGVSMPQWIRETLKGSKALEHVLDPELRRELDGNQKKMLMVLGVALMCTREHAHERPDMSEVLKMLSDIKERPARSSPSTRQRNEEIRQEVPGIEIEPSPPVTPSPRSSSLSHHPFLSRPPSSSLPSSHSLSHTPSLSSWSPTQHQ